jgi:hypothetical protein
MSGGRARVKTLTALAGLILLAGAVADARAQGAADGDGAAAESPYKLERGMYEFGAWGGGSPGSTTFYGRSADRKLVIAGFRAGRVMGTKKHFAFEMTVDVIPFLRLVQPKEARPLVTDDGRLITAVSGPDATAVGVSPVGLKFQFRRRERVQPFVEGTGGVLVFDRNVPYDAARRFNYTFGPGAGVQILSRSRQALTLGYSFHHVSNAYTGRINPGVDSHVFRVGYSVFRR